MKSVLVVHSTFRFYNSLIWTGYSINNKEVSVLKVLVISCGLNFFYKSPLYNQEQKNATFSKSIFSYLYLSKYTILYTKLNTIGWTLWWWKLYQNIFYDKYFISLWKRPLKNTSHKKRHFHAETRFCWELRVRKLETKTIVYKKKQTICQYSTRLSTLQFLL